MRLRCCCGASAEFLDNLSGCIEASKWQDRHMGCPELVLRNTQSQEKNEEKPDDSSGEG